MSVTDPGSCGVFCFLPYFVTVAGQELSFILCASNPITQVHVSFWVMGFIEAQLRKSASAVFFTQCVGTFCFYLCFVIPVLLSAVCLFGVERVRRGSHPSTLAATLNQNSLSLGLPRGPPPLPNPAVPLKPLPCQILYLCIAIQRKELLFFSPP